MNAQKKPNAPVLKAKVGQALTEDHLSVKLYTSVLFMVLELVQNGIDACLALLMTTRLNIKDHPPRVHIDIMEAGKHPYSAGSCICITDFGTGLINPERFMQIGRNGDEDGQGVAHLRKGIGRFAAHGLSGAPKEKDFHIFTSPIGEKAVIHYHFNTEKFRTDGIQPNYLKRSDVPFAPKEGSFTCIMVPNWNESFTQTELVQFIAERAPLHPWAIEVNGIEVEPYRYETKINEKTPEIADLDNAAIEVKLGLKPYESAPGVRLVDAITKRVVSVGSSYLSRISPLFLHPELTGDIFLAGLERYATTDRSHLVKELFWDKTPGNRLCSSLRAFILDPVQDLLQESYGDQTIAIFSTLAHLTQNADIKMPAPSEQDSNNNKRGKRRRNNNNTNTGHRNDKKSTTGTGQSNQLILEGEEYDVSILRRTPEHGPVVLSLSDNTFRIYVRHPFCQAALSGSNRKEQQKDILGLVVHAYTAEMYPDSKVAYSKHVELLTALIEEVNQSK